VRRIYENGLSCRSLYPAALRPAAREDELIDFPFFDHAELQIAIEWRGCNRVPIRHGSPFYLWSLYAGERSSPLCDLSKTNPARKHPGRVPFGKKVQDRCILPAVRSAYIVVASAAFGAMPSHLNRRDAIKISPDFPDGFYLRESGPPT